MFGQKVKAMVIDDMVVFDQKSFIRSLGKERAQRIMLSMRESFDFLGQEGVDELVSNGKEHLLCTLVLMDRNTNDELREYASAWVSAYEMLKGGL